MDDFPNLSQYRDVMSEMVRKKVVVLDKIKKMVGQPFFWLLFFGCAKKSNTPSKAEYARLVK